MPLIDSVALIKTVRHVFQRIGVDVRRYDRLRNSDARREFLLRRNDVNLVLDVGANEGQFGQEVRSWGYRGRIVSFEPVSGARRALERRALADPHWEVLPYALGDQDTTVEINVAANSQSSSLREMLPLHASAAPDSGYVGRERVEMRRLDTVLAEGFDPSDRLFLKMDTQGHERAVLDGAPRTLERVRILQFEASVVPLYQGESLWPELNEYVTRLGFELTSLDPVWVDPRTGQLMQIDATYARIA